MNLCTLFSARRLPYGLAVLSLAALTCAEAPPVAPEQEPPEETSFVEYRAWTQPERIEAAPYVENSYLLPTSLSTSGSGELHVLIRTPDDSLAPHHERYRMTYLHYDGARWSRRAEIDGYGWFTPSTSIAAGPHEAHLFWGGIPPERYQDWLNYRVSSLGVYYCRWNGTTCSTPVSLAATTVPGDRTLLFNEAVRDRQGRLHLVVDFQGPAYHLILTPQGQLVEKTLK